MKQATTGSFKMSKSTKRMLMTMTGNNKSSWKKEMIDAEVTELRAKQMKHKEVKSNEPQGE